jgi:acyl-CoA thioesterase-1
MKRGGHTPSEPERAAGRQHSIRGAGQQNFRPYGAITRAFNAVRSHALYSRPHKGPLALLILCLVLVTSPVMARVPVILDFGDSLTAGYGVPVGQAFPARLQAWLQERGIAARVVNAGVSGDTTAGGLARLDWALADKPDLVILALGANDALRGIEPSTVRDNLDKMIGKIEATGAKVLLLGMLAPPNWGEEYKQAFDRIFPELAHLHHLPLYPFFLEGVAMKPELNQPDGLHPNERGVAVLVDRIAPVVADLIGGAS